MASWRKNYLPAVIFVLFFPLKSSSAFSIPPLRGSNRFFLDTADAEEWKELLPLGLFRGITTNPSILENCKVPCTVSSVNRLAENALDVTEEFMCQAWGTNAEEMYQRGMELSAPDREKIVVKCPVTPEGTKAASRLISKGVRLCLTACYDRKQSLIASTIGAEYLAPYLGRMGDNGKDGVEECLAMEQIARGLGSETRILVASIRDVQDMAYLSSQGMDTFTFSAAVCRAIFDEPLTMKAAKDFEGAAQRGGS